MELRIMMILISVFIVCFVKFASTGGENHHHKKILIHIPVNEKHHKHIHTIVKHIHHHHKPIVIKEEKIIKKEVHKPIHIKEEVNHEHFHHHYKHDHPHNIEIDEEHQHHHDEEIGHIEIGGGGDEYHGGHESLLKRTTN